MACVKSKDTTPELVVRRLVHSTGFRYRLHVTALPGSPDLVFSRLGKIIIVNGCFWHMHTCGRCRVPNSRRDYWLKKLARNARRDKQNLRGLRKSGWKILIVWECQTVANNLPNLCDKLQAFLGGPTSKKAPRQSCTMNGQKGSRVS